MLIPDTGATLIPGLSILSDEPDEGPQIPKLPHITQAAFAGILVAISGNVIISLALNCQKLAHKRLEKERELHAEELRDRPSNGTRQRGAPAGERRNQDRSRPVYDDIFESQDEESTVSEGTPNAVAIVETEPLLNLRSDTPSTTYGSHLDNTSGQQDRRAKKPRLLSRLFQSRKDDRRVYHDADTSHLATTHALIPVEIVPVHNDTGRNGNGTEDINGGKKAKKEASEGDYLKSKLWWLGFILMNVGELGNFISYAFAPASVVAPLGTFALIANCIFAPLMLKERFRKRDFLGILIAIIGAVTVVLSANPSDVRLDPQGLIHAITQRPFIMYTAVYIAGIVVLAWLSERESGKKHVYVDVGLCALFGGFTVLSTKAISTLLTLEWFEIFTEWITYPVIAILLGTGIGQIRYLNRALMRFDSRIVVPTQFVMFNLSAIIGSAILYGDFIEATFHQIVTFLYGCAATFAGVFIIAWAPSSAPESAELEGMADEGLETEAGNSFGAQSRSGSLTRSPRVKLVVPDSAATTPILRSRHSIVSMYGLSPAQRVLLLSSPPRDEGSRPRSQDTERQLTSTPDSVRRRRTVSWLGDDAMHGARRPIAVPNFGTRENSRTRAQSTTASRSVSQSPF